MHRGATRYAIMHRGAAIMHRGAGRAAMRVGLLLCAALSSGCPADREGVDLGDPKDLATPPACTPGSVRCGAGGDRVEVCDGTSWSLKQTCDATVGASCLGGACRTPCEQVTEGNVGCKFYPANLWSTSTTGNFGIVASNAGGRIPAQITLSDASGQIQQQTAPAGGLVVFRLDHGKNKLDRTEQAKKSFYLESTSPVAVYQFHPIDAAQVWSGSATVLLPEHVMSRNYFVMVYTYNAAHMTTPPQGAGYVAVTALEDNTQVELTVPVETQAGGGVPAVAAGAKLRRTLNRLEVLEVTQAKSLEDISGAVVKANKKVVVYGGAGGVTIPKEAVGGNHLGVQMFPLETWGKHYLSAAYKRRNGSDTDYYRVVGSVDGTHVTFKGAQGAALPGVQTIGRGEVFEFNTALDFEIEADQPVMVYQYMVAWGNLVGTFDPMDFPDGAPRACNSANPLDVRCLGDANMAPLTPIEQYRSEYLFYVPETYLYNYMNLTGRLAGTYLLDGQPVTDTAQAIGTAGYGRVTVRLSAGNHRISGAYPFGLLNYGYASYTSYSYPGGMNLQNINPVD